MMSYERQIEQIMQRLGEMPRGTLVYKNIKGKKQPYLQWTEHGKSKCCYIKIDDREKILLELEERKSLQEKLHLLQRYSSEVLKIMDKNPYLARNAGIGLQDYAKLMEWKALYVDKTEFIREWWESEEDVTLITRPRRFGKTLMLSTVNCFFSTKYQGRSDLFEGLSIWKKEAYRSLQGTYPVIFTTFAAVKGGDYRMNLQMICGYFQDLYGAYSYLETDDILSDDGKRKYREYYEGLNRFEEYYCVRALQTLSQLLMEYYEKPVLILLDEYDTPLQEAYLYGGWEPMIELMRKLFNATFKSNPYLKKALLTGITRVTKEALFSDLNNLGVYTVTSNKYSEYFGFTEAEVQGMLKCHDMDEMEKVKDWYDGFTFGQSKEIYNPWSILNFMSRGQFQPYWVNSGGMGLISRLLLNGTLSQKEDLERLLQGESIHKVFDENITFMQLDHEPEAIWPLLVASGYLKVDHAVCGEYTEGDLSITNRETRSGFRKMVLQWFASARDVHNRFCRALLAHDVELMTDYLNLVMLTMVSVFDVGTQPSEKAPERFYHGLVLGMIVELADKYVIKSNRESGLGRYDIMMLPVAEEYDGIIIEFKVRDERKEADLQETAHKALQQIEQKQYEMELIQTGVPRERIYKYGFAFEGKTVHIEA